MTPVGAAAPWAAECEAVGLPLAELPVLAVAEVAMVMAAEPAVVVVGIAPLAPMPEGAALSGNAWRNSLRRLAASAGLAAISLTVARRPETAEGVASAMAASLIISP